MLRANFILKETLEDTKFICEKIKYAAFFTPKNESFVFNRDLM